MSTQDQHICTHPLEGGQLTRPACDPMAEKPGAKERYHWPTSYSWEETKGVLEATSPDHRGVFVTLAPGTGIIISNHKPGPPGLRGQVPSLQAEFSILFKRRGISVSPLTLYTPFRGTEKEKVTSRLDPGGEFCPSEAFKELSKPHHIHSQFSGRSVVQSPFSGQKMEGKGE